MAETHSPEIHSLEIHSLEIHSLLARQLRRHFGSEDQVPESLRGFLHDVGEAYRESDDDRRMLERSMDLSSQELLAANAELRGLIHELETKNTDLERFSYAISHDLKGPVFTIQGFLTLLKKDARAGDIERLDADIRRINDAAAQIRLLLDELLEFTRIGQKLKQPLEVSLRDQATKAADLLAGQLVASGVEVDVADDLPTVLGDRARILRVFQNLIENAVKFMGEQSAPRIEIFVRQGFDEDRAGESVCCVRDNGIGIDPSHHEKVFGLFDRLQPDMEGSGIGLALVKRVVEVHGGRVWVESEGKGRGCTFCFTMPRRA